MTPATVHIRSIQRHEQVGAHRVGALVKYPVLAALGLNTCIPGEILLTPASQNEFGLTHAVGYNPISAFTLEALAAITQRFVPEDFIPEIIE